MTTANTDLIEQISDYRGLPRSIHPEEWSNSLHDDYAAKSQLIIDLIERVNLLSLEVYRLQQALASQTSG